MSAFGFVASIRFVAFSGWPCSLTSTNNNGEAVPSQPHCAASRLSSTPTLAVQLAIPRQISTSLGFLAYSGKSQLPTGGKAGSLLLPFWGHLSHTQNPGRQRLRGESRPKSGAVACLTLYAGSAPRTCLYRSVWMTPGVLEHDGGPAFGGASALALCAALAAPRLGWLSTRGHGLGCPTPQTASAVSGIFN